MPPPPNDDFLKAELVTGTVGSVTGTNVGATKEVGEPKHGGTAGGASIWYRWQALSSGSARFATTGSNVDTLLAVYTGSSVSGLTPVASNDDSNNTLQSVVTFEAQTGVVYYVAVDGVGGATGSILFGWDLPPVNNERGPMTNGATHTGVIGKGDTDAWSFQANQNDGITLSMGEVAGSGADPGFVPWIRLRAPNGALLENTWNSNSAELGVRAPQTGIYTVVVASHNSSQMAVGNYVLTLAKTPGPYSVSSGDEGGPLTNGATHTGVIGVGDLDAWSFPANQNDGVAISIGEVAWGGPDPGFVPWIRLRGPDGALLENTWNPNSAELGMRAPQTGIYTVLVASNNYNQIGIGNYVLTLAKTPGPYSVSSGDEGGPLTNGATHTGVIGVGDMDAWSFQAAQNDGITVSIGEVAGSGVDPGFVPWIRLRGPDGALLENTWNPNSAELGMRAPQTGIYTVIVASNNYRQIGVGNYVLTLAKTPGPYSVSMGDEGGPLTNGATHTGVIGVGDMDAWSFQANQNDSITVSIGEVAGSGGDPGFIPWIRLRGPDGALLENIWDSNSAQLKERAPQTGVYTVVVASNNYSQIGPGNYVLTVSGSTRAPCVFTLAAANTSMPARGGLGSVSFTSSGRDCAWSATSNASFITMSAPTSGTGSGTVSFSVLAHTNSTPRTGTLTVGGQTFTVNQTASAWESVVLTGDQTEIKIWSTGGRTYAYVKLMFPSAGYRVTNWGQPNRAGNEFTVSAAVETFNGGSVQAVTTTAQIYDLGQLANGTYNFNFKTSGATAKTLQFTISSAVPPPNPIDTAREFVKQQYRDFLNREADPAGESFWTDNITKCNDSARRPAGQTEAQCTLRQRETTSGSFFLSPEFQYTGYYVYRMYQGALGRQPKLSEFTPDAEFVGNGIVVNGQLSAAKINQNKADFAAQFVNCTDGTKYRCAEFKGIYDGLSNQAYVDRLFLTTGVNAGAADRTALVNGLNGGTDTRASVLRKVVDGITVISEGNQQFTTTYGQAFYNSQFNRAFVQLEYFGYMKRDPDDAGYAFWLGKLNQFGGSFVNAEMVLAFISSAEYRARFGQP